MNVRLTIEDQARVRVLQEHLAREPLRIRLSTADVVRQCIHWGIDREEILPHRVHEELVELKARQAAA